MFTGADPLRPSLYRLSPPPTLDFSTQYLSRNSLLKKRERSFFEAMSDPAPSSSRSLCSLRIVECSRRLRLRESFRLCRTAGFLCTPCPSRPPAPHGKSTNRSKPGLSLRNPPLPTFPLPPPCSSLRPFPRATTRFCQVSPQAPELCMLLSPPLSPQLSAPKHIEFGHPYS